MLFYPGDFVTEVPVRWYFADDDARPLGFPSVFVSRNWLDKSWPTEPTIGETPGAARPWCDGAAPSIKPKGSPCGTPTQFLNGATAFADPPYTPVVWGEPPCCFPSASPACPVLTRIDQRAEELLYGLAALICSLYGGNPFNMDDVANAMTRIAIANARMFRPGDILPSWVAYWNAEQCLVAITGTVNIRQLLMQALSAVIPTVPAGAYSCSAFIIAAGRAVQMELYAAGLPMDRPLMICGHSYGGSVATYIGAQEKILRPDRDVKVVTFGEPRSMNIDGQNWVRGMHTRVQGAGDYVTQLPPDLTGLYALIFGVGVLVFQRWLRFVNSSEGLQVNDDGTLTSPDDEGIPVLYLADTVFQFLTGGTIDVMVEHGMAAYTSRLFTAAHRVPFILPQRCFDVPAIDLVMLSNPCSPTPMETDIEAGGTFSIEGSAAIAVKDTLLPGGRLAFVGAAPLRQLTPLDSVGGLALVGSAPITVISVTALASGGILAARGTAPIEFIYPLSAGGSLAFKGAAPMANLIRIESGGVADIQGHALVMNSGIRLTSGGKGATQGTAPIVEHFHTVLTSSGTWPGVSGVTSYRVIARGAGGCGSMPDTGLSVKTGGGGGGATARSDITGTSGFGFTYTVGSSAGDGSDGGDTFIGDGSVCLAAGGKGPGEGIKGVLTGMPGGSSADCVFNLDAFSGGAGADAAGTDAGGGGGGAGDQVDGDDASGATGGAGGADGGGDGGDGDVIGGMNGEDGDAPGGGGGGGSDTAGNWASGGNGQIDLFYVR